MRRMLIPLDEPLDGFTETFLPTAREATQAEQIHFTLILLNGRLYVVYSVFGQDGVYEISGSGSSGRLTDGLWHRVVLGVDRRTGRVIIYLDSHEPLVR
ncbi:unnamed protein product [Protopolystoma xenopodis]|uniref:Laminin G domain-containing protein n=1 Tax=Protopolystoma xenopodis TaxID=117903 RepID=A0A448XDL0_9PLAT|nr:unnamed protein product [Protopolystoma xenopodis]